MLKLQDLGKGMALGLLISIVDGLVYNVSPITFFLLIMLESLVLIAAVDVSPNAINTTFRRLLRYSKGDVVIFGMAFQALIAFFILQMWNSGIR